VVRPSNVRPLHKDLRFPERGGGPRLSMDVLFLLGLAVAFVFAHYSDKPPLVERPIRIERADHPRIADNPRIGVMVQDTGLRGVER
jgi:hypothetical protein